MRKTTTRQYNEICKECYGKGMIMDNYNSTSAGRTCPVCNGTGKVMVTETVTEDTDIHDHSLKII